VILTAPCSEPNSYIHLAGRTGRQGHPGEVWTLAYGEQENAAIAKTSSYLKLAIHEVPLEDIVRVQPRKISRSKEMLKQQRRRDTAAGNVSFSQVQ